MVLISKGGEIRAEEGKLSRERGALPRKVRRGVSEEGRSCDGMGSEDRGRRKGKSGECNRRTSNAVRVLRGEEIRASKGKLSGKTRVLTAEVRRGEV